MPKYLISWTEEDFLNITIDAGSKKEALDKFWNREYDGEDIVHVGTELQDSVECEEV